jgi:hypothetical protein
MSDAKPARGLWYARRDGVVRGPYPEQQISRYILLGRIRECDELRHSDGDWAGLSRYPELVPEVVKLPPSEGNRRELALAKLRAEQRGPADRRRGGMPRYCARERRAAVERRRPQDEDILRRDGARYQTSERTPGNLERCRYALELGVLVLLCFFLTYLLGPGGADLSGADLSHAIRIDRKSCIAGSVGACLRRSINLSRVGGRYDPR